MSLWFEYHIHDINTNNTNLLGYLKGKDTISINFKSMSYHESSFHTSTTGGGRLHLP